MATNPYHSHQNVGNVHILNAQGKPLRLSGSSNAANMNTGGSVGPPGGYDVEIATLTQRLKGAFVWLGLLTGAAGVAFIFSLERVDEVNNGVGDVKTSVAAQGATLHEMKDSLNRLADKLDEGDVRSTASSRSR